MLKQISVFVGNKPGTVYAIMETLKNAEINVRAMCIVEEDDRGIARLIVKEPEKTEAVLKKEGFITKLHDVIGVSVPDKFGALCDILRLLSEKEINIGYAYSLMGCKHGNANILIYIKEVKKAEEILTKAGVKLFTNKDLE
jgi:hypothetical protein